MTDDEIHEIVKRVNDRPYPGDRIRTYRDGYLIIKPDGDVRARIVIDDNGAVLDVVVEREKPCLPGLVVIEEGPA